MSKAEPPSDLELKPFGDGPLDADVRHQFDTAVEPMLQTGHQRRNIFGAYFLSSLSHPLFSNLSKLSLNRRIVGRFEELWDAMAPINFGTTMPKLEEVKI